MPRQRLLRARFAAKERMRGLYCRCRAHGPLQLPAVTGVGEDLPRPEHPLAQLEPRLAELLLGGEPFCVRFEVSPQVRPAELTALKRQMRIGPPAVGGDDRLGIGEQRLGAILVAVSFDREVGVALIEEPPQRAPLTGGAPASLIHVQRLRGAQSLEQVVVGAGERVRGAREDRVDRARADAAAEQLFAELHRILARNTVSHRQRRHRRFKARAKAAPDNLGFKLCPRALAALGAAQSLGAVLDHADRDRRQLFPLMARRLAHCTALITREHMAAAATRRPAIDDLVHRPRRQQRTAAALVAALSAPLAPRGILAARRGGGRIGARWTRGVARALAQLALELLDAGFQLLDAAVHPQQHLDDCLASRVVDGLRLTTVHAS
jgi:hypothetical protein